MNALTNVKKMIVNAGPGIPSAEDKALELDNELQEAMDEVVGTLTSEIQSDGPVKIAKPIAAEFGAKPTTNVPSMATPKSPEDTEKEYLRNAEKTIGECNDEKKSCLAQIHKHEEGVSELRENIEVYDRMVAREIGRASCRERV